LFYVNNSGGKVTKIKIKCLTLPAKINRNENEKSECCIHHAVAGGFWCGLWPEWYYDGIVA
jgi:hypothetical protein